VRLYDIQTAGTTGAPTSHVGVNAVLVLLRDLLTCAEELSGRFL
jgi:hypothetical protein